MEVPVRVPEYSAKILSFPVRMSTPEQQPAPTVAPKSHRWFPEYGTLAQWAAFIIAFATIGYNACSHYAQSLVDFR